MTYFDDILNKDLAKRYRIRKTEALKKLAKFYFTNMASPITFNSMSKFLNLSTDTVEKFSDYFSTAYLIFFLKRFSFKTKEQEKSPRKVYAVDTGLANAVGFRFSQNSGHLAENIVFSSLQREKMFNPGLELYYWKDSRHNEVDFLIKEGLKVNQAIQVCWQINQPQTKEREIKNLRKVMKEFKLSEGLIITEDDAGEEKVKEGKIKLLPLWQWLLNREIKAVD